jgi:hypothetical protein
MVATDALVANYMFLLVKSRRSVLLRIRWRQFEALPLDIVLGGGRSRGNPFVESIRRDPGVINNAELDIAEFEGNEIVRGCHLLFARSQALESRRCPRHQITI